MITIPVPHMDLTWSRWPKKHDTFDKTETYTFATYLSWDSINPKERSIPPIFKAKTIVAINSQLVGVAG